MVKNRWLAIQKAVNKSGCIPKEINTPISLNATWNCYVSDRSNGKTTSWLIYAIVAYYKFGIITHYVRSSKTMITQSAVMTIFSVIIDNKYVSTLTNNEWNSVMYVRNDHKFYLCNRDDDGEISEQDNTGFLMCMSIDKADEYKSGYQCDKGDLILFDEFINSYYRRGEFVRFCDLISTIIRKRTDCKIVMLANTILRTSEYFDELECREFIDHAEGGDKIEYEIPCESGGSTSVHMEVLSPKLNDTRKKFNAKYFSFHNPLLYSITGSGWAVKNYRHPTESFKVLHRNIFLEYKNKFYSLNVVQLECGRYTLFVAPHTHEPKEDAYIYSDNYNPFDKRYHSLMHDKNRFDTWVLNRFYTDDIIYANNTCGSIMHDYINNYR